MDTRPAAVELTVGDADSHAGIAGDVEKQGRRLIAELVGESSRRGAVSCPAGREQIREGIGKDGITLRATHARPSIPTTLEAIKTVLEG